MRNLEMNSVLGPGVNFRDVNCLSVVESGTSSTSVGPGSYLGLGSICAQSHLTWTQGHLTWTHLGLGPIWTLVALCLGPFGYEYHLDPGPNGPSPFPPQRLD